MLSLRRKAPDPKATVYAVVLGTVLYILIERPNAAQRKDNELSSLADSTRDIEAGSTSGLAADDGTPPQQPQQQ